DPTLIGEIAAALEHVRRTSPESSTPTSVDPEEHVRVSELPTSSHEHHTLEPSTAAAPLPAAVAFLPSLRKGQRNVVSGRRRWPLIALVTLVIAGTLLGSASLLAHFGVFGAHSGSSTLTP